jgi:hypothetical protein
MAQAGLELEMILLQPAECWDYRCVPPRLLCISFLHPCLMEHYSGMNPMFPFSFLQTLRNLIHIDPTFLGGMESI